MLHKLRSLSSMTGVLMKDLRVLGCGVMPDLRGGHDTVAAKLRHEPYLVRDAFDGNLDNILRWRCAPAGTSPEVLAAHVLDRRREAVGRACWGSCGRSRLRGLRLGRNSRSRGGPRSS